MRIKGVCGVRQLLVRLYETPGNRVSAEDRSCIPQYNSEEINSVGYPSMGGCSQKRVDTPPDEGERVEDGE